MTSLSPYPYYKPSGLDWLGDMPTHWSIERAKWLFHKMDRPVRDTDEVVTCFRDGMVTLRKNRRELGFTESIKEIGYQGIRRGDLIIHAMDAFAGAIGVSDSDGKGTPVYSVCRATSFADSYYYAYILREMARNKWIQSLSKGVRERSSDFRYADFSRQFLPLPTLREQTAIVRYLDRADTSIRRYIANKERLIELLTERKQAVINQTVTRGLDSNVPLKPSGVEWLGDVPAHWEVRRIKTLGILKGGAGFPHAEQGNLNYEYPFFKVGDMGTHENERNMQVWQHTVSASTAQRLRATIFPRNTLVFAKVGVALMLNRRRLLTRASCIDNNMMALTLNSCDPNWARYLLSIVDLTRLANPGAVPSINERQVGDIYLIYPPLAEQTAIVEYLDKATADIDVATDRARRQIELMLEYRTRLIADVVTGKLDVRGAVADDAEIAIP